MLRSDSSLYVTRPDAHMSNFFQHRSLDGGRTWRDHRVISDRANLNYTAIREISPGRLLYMHDGQIPDTLVRINSLYIDIDRLKP